MLWSKRLSVIPSESPAPQWALEGSHVDVVRDRMVAEDAVTSFGHKCLAARHESFQMREMPNQEPATNVLTNRSLA